VHGIGLLVGFAALCLFAIPYFRRHKAPLNFAPLVALSLTTVVILHDIHLPVERLLNRFALFGRSATGVWLDKGNTDPAAVDTPLEQAIHDVPRNRTG